MEVESGILRRVSANSVASLWGSEVIGKPTGVWPDNKQYCELESCLLEEEAPLLGSVDSFVEFLSHRCVQ